MGFFDFVSDVVSGAVDIVSDVATGTADIVGNVVSGTVDVAGSVASGAADLVSSAVGGTADVISDVVSGTVDAIGNTGSEVVDYISENPIKALLATAATVATGRAAPAIITTFTDTLATGTIKRTNNECIGGDIRYPGKISLPRIPNHEEEVRNILVKRMPGPGTEMPLPEKPEYKEMMGEIKKLAELLEEIEKQQPVNTLEIGSVVYCHLALLAEHSGIYIGDNQIVHLNGDGLIEKVSPKVFLARLGGFNPNFGIFVSCQGKSAIGSMKIAERAISMTGATRNYHAIMDNCHQFTAGCITGDFENSCNFKTLLDSLVIKHLKANTWRRWDQNK